ncbi:MAG: TraB/GumN family protein [Candidatus Obscuribacterales bacterium]|nr:TraB/GumN family protein [Candidatus Obscuribacterales bacterium]
MPARTEESKNVEIENRLLEKLTELVKEFYTKAKITKNGGKIHFEYKSRPNLNTTSGRQEIIPAYGGVIGDLDIKSGPYTGKLKVPQMYSEYASYSVVIIAPYSKEHDLHVFAKLSYPTDAQHEFVDRFQSVVNGFAVDIAPESKGEASAKSSTEATRPMDESTKVPTVANSSSASEAAKPITPGSSLLPLWKVTRDGATAYVSGILEWGKNRYYPITGEMGRRFKESKLLVVETEGQNDDKESDCYPDGDKLSNHLSDETKVILNQYLEWADEPLSIYEIQTIRNAIYAFNYSALRTVGFNSIDIEKQLKKEAKRLGKPVVGLETYGERHKQFNDLSADAQDKIFRSCVLQMFDFQSYQKDLEDAWINGDSKAALEVIERLPHAKPELTDAHFDFYYVKNPKMAAKLESYLEKESPVFLAMDICCLLGEQGLLKELSKKGFVVEQMSGNRPVVSEGVLTELPYEESSSKVEESNPSLAQAHQLYRLKKYKDALALLGRLKLTDDVRLLRGQCYLGENMKVQARAEFTWLVKNSKSPTIKKDAQTALSKIK